MIICVIYTILSVRSCHGPSDLMGSVCELLSPSPPPQDAPDESVTAKSMNTFTNQIYVLVL